MIERKHIKKIAFVLATVIGVFLFRVWLNDKWHKLPDFLLVLTGVLIPIALVGLAVLFASKHTGR